MNNTLETKITSLTAKVTEANDNKFTFSINDLIEEVQEEIKMRRHVYGNHVLQGKKTQRQADKKIEAMENILKLLKAQRDSHIIHTKYTILGHPLLIEYHGIRSDFREQRLLGALGAIFAQAHNNLNILWESSNE